MTDQELVNKIRGIVKEEFIGMCDSAIGFKESTDDIENCKSLKEWLKKWENCTDDDYAYQLAKEHFEEL